MSTSYLHPTVPTLAGVPTSPATPDQPRDWGLVTIQVVDFKPRGLRSQPPSVTDSCGTDVALMFAIAFNQSHLAKQRRRWALVGSTGSVLTITDVDAETRPTDPTAFPPIVVSGLTMIEAIELAEAANRPRLEHAVIPRLWTIAVMPLARAESDQDSLRGCILRQAETIQKLQNDVERLKGSGVPA